MSSIQRNKTLLVACVWSVHNRRVKEREKKEEYSRSTSSAMYPLGISGRKIIMTGVEKSICKNGRVYGREAYIKIVVDLHACSTP